MYLPVSTQQRDGGETYYPGDVRTLESANDAYIPTGRSTSETRGDRSVLLADSNFLAVVMCIQQAGFHGRFSNCTQGRTLAVVLGSKPGVKFSIPQQLPDRMSFSVLQKKTSMSMKILLL